MSAPTSKVEICNMALSWLHQEFVSDIDSPTTKTEKVCKLFYDQIRRATLRKHTWNFAKKRALLAALADAPAYGFNTKYLLPVDYIRLVGIGEDENEYHYEVENGELLIDYTESDGLPLRYIYDHTTISKWDPLFISCLTLELAIAMAPQFGKSVNEIQTLIEYLDEIAPEAYSVVGQERPPVRVEDSRARRARRGYRSRRNDVIED